MEKLVGSLAKSKAGHDKNEIFVIVKEETEYVYLSDGRLRKLEQPKRKNKKHIQLIKNNDSALIARIQDGTIKDEEIKRIIKLYNRR